MGDFLSKLVGFSEILLIGGVGLAIIAWLVYAWFGTEPFCRLFTLLGTNRKVSYWKNPKSTGENSKNRAVGTGAMALVIFLSVSSLGTLGAGLANWLLHEPIIFEKGLHEHITDGIFEERSKRATRLFPTGLCKELEHFNELDLDAFLYNLPWPKGIQRANDPIMERDSYSVTLVTGIGALSAAGIVAGLAYIVAILICLAVKCEPKIRAARSTKRTLFAVLGLVLILCSSGLSWWGYEREFHRQEGIDAVQNLLANPLAREAARNLLRSKSKDKNCAALDYG